MRFYPPASHIIAQSDKSHYSDHIEYGPKNVAVQAPLYRLAKGEKRDLDMFYMIVFVYSRGKNVKHLTISNGSFV